MNGLIPTTFARRWPAGLGSTMLVVALLSQAGGVARAQGGRELEEQAVEAAVVARPSFDFGITNFYQRIYGAANQINVTRREHLDSLLTLVIDEVDRACLLSEAQRNKLVLAGHGDRKRFMDRVDEALRAFERLRHDPNAANEIFQATQPLAADYEFGLFGEGSFFAKMLATTLTPEQASRYREAQQEKLKFRYRAKVTLILSSLDSAVGFSSEQQKKYADLILDETAPPRSPGSPYESNVVLLKIAMLPEAKVRPIFDDLQWKSLDRILARARGTEEFLRANGHLD